MPVSCNVSDVHGGLAACILFHASFQQFGHYVSHLEGQERRDSVPHLSVLVGAETLEKIIVRKGL